MNQAKADFDLRAGIRTSCPVCGHPLDRFEQALAQNDSNFQCRHCWTRIGHGNGVTKKAYAHSAGSHRR